MNIREKVEGIVIKKRNEADDDGIAQNTGRELHVMGDALAKDNKELFRNIMKDENKDDKNKIKKCATNLLALKIIIELMERIDKGEFGEELTNSYHLSTMDISLIRGWETEKANSKERISDTDERMVKLREFHSDFTKFINSKQQGNNPSELTAIGLIGFALVVLMHLGFPEGITGVGAFSVHLFILFTSTIVVFLFCNIRDLENDRYRSLHDVGSTCNSELWKGSIQRTYSSPRKKGIFIVSMITAFVYGVLLWDKLVNSFSFLH